MTAEGSSLLSEPKAVLPPGLLGAALAARACPGRGPLKAASLQDGRRLPCCRLAALTPDALFMRPDSGLFIMPPRPLRPLKRPQPPFRRSRLAPCRRCRRSCLYRATVTLDVDMQRRTRQTLTSRRHHRVSARGAPTVLPTVAPSALKGTNHRTDATEKKRWAAPTSKIAKNRYLSRYPRVHPYRSKPTTRTNMTNISFIYYHNGS